MRLVVFLFTLFAILSSIAVVFKFKNETGHLFGSSLELNDNHVCPDAQCPTFFPGGCMSRNVGYLFAFIAVMFFGTNFVPVKFYDLPEDGMFYQWIMCSAIWTVGFCVMLIRKQPPFEPLAVLGGFLWASGNVLCVPIINFIGLGMGLLIWGCVSMILGWATGTFGLFGLEKSKLSKPTLNYIGVVFALISLALFIFVKPEEKGKKDEEDLIRRTPLNTERENRRNLSESNKSPGGSRRVIGIAMATISGLFFGGNFDPPKWVMAHKAGSRQAGLDYVFAHFCGIYITSTFLFILYTLKTKNKPKTYSEAIVPTLISGVMWAIAQVSWFVANDCLSFSISYPVITGGPGIVGALIGIYFGEIKGKRNFIFLGSAIVSTVIADIFITQSF